jgi:hypothetical protein
LIVDFVPGWYMRDAKCLREEMVCLACLEKSRMCAFLGASLLSRIACWINLPSWKGSGNGGINIFITKPRKARHMEESTRGWLSQ